MGSLMSVHWWTSTIMSVFITMVIMYLIKKYSNQYNIPVVKTVANGI